MRKIIITVTCILFIGQAYGANMKKAMFFSSSAGREVEVVADEVLVKFKGHVGRRGASSFSAAKGCRSIKQIGNLGVYKLQIPENSILEQLVQEYSMDPDIEYAEPNIIRKAFNTNDPHFTEQWGLHNEGQVIGGTAGVADTDINALGAWEVETGNSDILIAVLDSGVDLDHEDLVYNMHAGGYDFVNEDSDPSDDYGHGTHVAGIIGAKSNNGKGVAGVCWSCKILAVKVLDSKGEGYDDDLIEGLEYAADLGADIINLSLGGPVSNEILEDAIDYAYARGSVICAAMGNNDEASTHYPAGYSNVIAVGAINNYGERCDSSDWGGTFGSTYGWHIDVVAPGNDILSTTMGNTYGYMNGTSMATPYVAGVCGLMLSWDDTQSNSQVMHIIKQTAVDVTAGEANTGFDMYTGSGTVNAFAALQKISETFSKENTVKVGNNFIDPAAGDKATVYYYVKTAGAVTVEVYNLFGEKIKTLKNNETVTAGRYPIEWDGRDDLSNYVPSGVYFVRMIAGEDMSVARVMVRK